jgi:hypothetical protein
MIGSVEQVVLPACYRAQLHIILTRKEYYQLQSMHLLLGSLLTFT